MGVPARGGRHELDCRLPDCASLGRLYRFKPAYSPGIWSLQGIWRLTRAADSGHHSHGYLLADSVLDVSQEALPQDLRPLSAALRVIFQNRLVRRRNLKFCVSAADEDWQSGQASLQL